MPKLRQEHKQDAVMSWGHGTTLPRHISVCLKILLLTENSFKTTKFGAGQPFWEIFAQKKH